MRAQVPRFPQEGQPGVAQHLDVAHHVGVGDGYEALRLEEAADLELVGDGAPHGLALRAIQHALFRCCELHLVSSTLLVEG